MERCVLNRCSEHQSPPLYHLQHGFLRERSTVTQRLEVCHNILNSVASEKEVDIIYLDLSKVFDISKVFDKVSHNLLLLKLNNYGISRPLLFCSEAVLQIDIKEWSLIMFIQNGFQLHQVFPKVRCLVRSCF